MNPYKCKYTYIVAYEYTEQSWTFPETIYIASVAIVMLY